MNGKLYGPNGSVPIATIENGTVWGNGCFCRFVMGRIKSEVLQSDDIYPKILTRLDGKMVKEGGPLGEFIAHIEGNIIYKGAGSGGTILGRFDGPDEVALAIFFFR